MPLFNMTEILNQLESLEKHQVILTEMLTGTVDTARGNLILSREQCAELLQKLEEYCHLLEPLERAYDGTIPSKSIAALKEELRSHLLVSKLDDAIKEANRFHLLETTNSGLIKELEEHKTILKQLVGSLVPESDITPLQPYRSFVRLVEETNKSDPSLSEDFDSVESIFSSRFLRGLWMSEFALRNSDNTTLQENTVENKENSSTVEPDPFEKAQLVEERIVVTTSDEDPSLQEESCNNHKETDDKDEAVLSSDNNCESAYDNLSLAIESGVGQPNKSVKKFNELLLRDQTGRLAYVFIRTAFCKVVASDALIELGDGLSDCANKLCQKGYIVKVSIQCNGITVHEGYTLTQLGYAFVSNANAYATLCRISGETLKLFPLSPSMITPTIALHGWLVGNYVLDCKLPDIQKTCHLDEERRLIYALARGDDYSLLFVPGVMISNSNNNAAETIESMYSLAIEKHAESLVIVVEHREDISRIHSVLSETSSQCVPVLFAVTKEKTSLFNDKGAAIMLDTLKDYFDARGSENPEEGNQMEPESDGIDDCKHPSTFEQDQPSETSIESTQESSVVSLTDESQKATLQECEESTSSSIQDHSLFIASTTEQVIQSDNSETGIIEKPDVSPIIGDDTQSIARHLLSLPNPLQAVDAQYKLIASLLAEKSWIEAVAFAKTLAEATNNPMQITLYQNILHAINSPLDEFHYSGSMSMELSRDNDLEKCCRIATMFWALCFPERPYDYDLRNTYRGIGEQILDDATPQFPLIKSAFTLLSGSIQEAIDKYYGGKGFSPRVLRSLSTDNSILQATKALREHARSLRDLPRNQIALKGIEEFFKATMGPTSMMGKCLDQIAQGSEDIQQLVNDAFSPFSEDGVNYTPDAVEEFIDNEWDKVRKGPGIKELKNESPARKLILKTLKQRLDLLSDWLQLNASTDKSIASETAGKFQRDVSEFCGNLRLVRTELQDRIQDPAIMVEEKAGLTLLMFVFERIGNMIELMDDNESHMKAQFLEFAKTPWIALNTNGLPILDKSFNDIPGMEPWRLVLNHICDLKTDLQGVLKEIQSKDSPWFEEYTTGSAILNSMDNSDCPYDLKYKKAYEDAEKKEKEFLGRLRQNYAYGRISEASKETIMMLLEKQKGYFINQSDEEDTANHNYRHYYMLLECLDSIQVAETAQRKKKLQTAVEDRIHKLPTYDIKTPESLSIVERSIENGNLSMAEEYLTRYDTDPHSLKAVNLGQITNRVKWHDQLLKDADTIYEEACNKQSNKNKHPSSWAINFIQKSKFPYKWSTPNEKASAEKLIQNWIPGKDNPRTPSYLVQFLQALGFQPLEGVSFEKKSKGKQIGQDYEIFLGKLKPSSAQLNSYPHPVAKFGTNSGGVQPIDVNLVCIYGSKSASTLYTVLQGLDIGNNPSIVFMDGALAVNERKNLAAKFKGQVNSRNPVLILDRVLLVFLASLNAGDRLPAFFQCTLPYTFMQLHTLGSGPVPDEMFFGRDSDLRRITDPDGECLVYGGRQLGKTALLKRAKSLNHKPNLGQYAFFLDLKDQGLDALIKKLNDTLTIKLLDNKPLLEKPCTSLEELCVTINNRSEAFKYLTILIDEADAFFRELEKNGYKQFHPIAVLRQETNNRVKFVFAGTHNVAQLRSANDNNKDTLQLGTSLCIKPLSMVDAANLITYPLAYLGFQIDEDQVAMILNNTNRYPGVIHMFCHNLVQVLCNSYNEFYSDKEISPPYHISEIQMAALFREKDLKKEVGRRVYATITVDQVDRQYEYIARLLAFLEYESMDSEATRLYGFTPEEIIACNKEYFEIPELMPNHTNIEKMDIVMTEMVDMGILWKKPDSSYYRFQQHDFLGYLGSKEENEEALLNYAEDSING